MAASMPPASSTHFKIRSIAVMISLKQPATRLEGIRPFSLDRFPQFRFPNRFDNHINIRPETLIEEGLDGAQIKKVKACSLGRRENDIHIAPLGAAPTRYRSKEGGMRNATCFERRAQVTKNGKGVITIHDQKIR